MSCRSFETTITDLARGQMLEARAKEEALAHVRDCRSCAARLADEQSLTAGLRVVATSAVLNEAPARVEALLLSTFRQRAASPFVPVSAPARARITPWPLWSVAGAAAAAVILVVAMLTLPRLLTSKQPARLKAQINQPTPLPLTINGPGESESPDGPTETATTANNPGREFVDYPAPGSMNRRQGLARPASINSRPNRGASSPEAPDTNVEIATEYLPLTYGVNLSQLEGGQVVRVELPRSAMQSFGLPMNAERAGERVKADVLLGHDGVARAIRFVR
ncbi:MAG TPA: hypothetical protein VF791_08615 [Pyrinomonadaceae bacterium]